jgi:cell division protein FtsZ
VHQINEIIHDAVGDEAEIIFGAVHEPAMQGEIRVTVIATGFDRQPSNAQPVIQEPIIAKSAPVLPFPTPRAQRTTGPVARIVPAENGPRRIGQTNPVIAPKEAPPAQDLSDMEIPTFIRRQMD